MNIEGKKIWQVGTGSHARSYGDLFKKFDAMGIGPGNEGLFSEEKYICCGGLKDCIRRFYQEAKKGDIVLLRYGTNKILAVGLIADEKPMINEEFGDIDDYHLQHVRRVRWFPDTDKNFPVRTLGGQVRTFARLRQGSVLNWLKRLQIPNKALTRPLASLPKESVTFNRKTVCFELSRQGMRGYTSNLSKELNRSIKLAKWYRNNEEALKDRPSEPETIAYLVIPLLFVLGWSTKTTAIEWNGIDIALFNRMPIKDSSLECIVEAKAMDGSVFEPLNQAERYASCKGRRHCKRLILTDGIRYTYFHKENNAFKLKAYLNILRMRKNYPLYGCAGAVEAIKGIAKR
jgi:hypothetical protein